MNSHLMNSCEPLHTDSVGTQSPRVSIGVPVYNGENYLAQSLDALLAQSFRDFELIISDNCSTDATSEICRRYVARDSRIRYHRADKNRGAAWNFNRLVELANGEFFMWAAHDDLWAPEFLEKCVTALDAQPDAVLCYTSTKVIGENRNKVAKQFGIEPQLASLQAHHRFSTGWRYPPQIPVFGLIRRNILKQTRMIGNYSASDQVLVSDLAMFGPFYGIPEYLFFYRRHAQQSTARPYPTMRARMAWFDPNNRVRVTFPHWRLLGEHIRSIWRNNPATIKERLLCSIELFPWIIRKRRFLLNDLILRDLRETRNLD